MRGPPSETRIRGALHDTTDVKGPFASPLAFASASCLCVAVTAAAGSGQSAFAGAADACCLVVLCAFPLLGHVPVVDSCHGDFEGLDGTGNSPAITTAGGEGDGQQSIGVTGKRS